MRILAIDPGSKLGWATDCTGRMEWGTEDFRIRNGESSGNRWRRFGQWLELTVELYDPKGRPADQINSMDELKLRPRVDLIVYERAVFSPNARAAAEIAAGFTTRLEEHCERHGIALQPVGVSTLKAFALPAPPRPKRKKGDPPAPRHDTSKEAMIRAAQIKLVEGVVMAGGPNVQVVMESMQPLRIDGHELAALTEHEADALWLYWWAKSQEALPS